MLLPEPSRKRCRNGSSQISLCLREKKKTSRIGSSAPAGALSDFQRIAFRGHTGFAEKLIGFSFRFRLQPAGGGGDFLPFDLRKCELDDEPGNQPAQYACNDIDPLHDCQFLSLFPFPAGMVFLLRRIRFSVTTMSRGTS